MICGFILTDEEMKFTEFQTISLKTLFNEV